MNLRCFIKPGWLCISLMLLSAVFIACGGSGGGTDGSGSVAASSGSVAVLLTDGPLEDLATLKILITKISLLPPGNGREVVLYENAEDPEPVNILEYRGEEYHTFSLAEDVPAGRYEKIRLEVADVSATAKEGAEGTCAELDIKLPSGKIDLNPRGGFEVVGGETIAIRLDIDARKSIQLHQAGNSGKCIFRPVIFVDIDTVYGGERCPAVIKGRVLELLNGETETGFVLELPGRRGTLDVIVNDNTVVFDENATPGGLENISAGDLVHVRGSLTSDGKLSASLVVVGDVLKLEGTAEDSGEDNQFELNLSAGQAFIDSSLLVSLADETLVLIGCDNEVDASYILPESRVTVIGKYSQDDKTLFAVAVIIKPREITGDLVGLSKDEDNGYSLLINPAGDGENKEVVLPAGEFIYLEGDGKVEFERLEELLGCGINPAVRVTLDPAAASSLTAQKVWVIPEEVSGSVLSIAENLITLDSNTIVAVEPTAKFFKDSKSVDLESIQVDDELTVFGLTACPDNTNADFFGYIVIVETD